MASNLCYGAGMGKAKTPFDRAIISVGSKNRMAKLLKVSRQAVQNWHKHGVPAERVLSVEAISGVSRSELRPDIYPA